MLGWLDRRFGGHEGFDFQVTDESGERVFSNPRLGEHRLPAPALETASDQPNLHTQQLANLGWYRIVSRKVTGPVGPVLVQVARSLDGFDHELAELLAVLVTLGPLVVGLALTGGYLLARRALAPVEQIATAANQIDLRRLGERIDVPTPDDELGKLAGTLNVMFDRLERSFKEMQRFTTDASHELRTPIAVIRAEAEVALSKPLADPEKQDLLGSILEECHRLTWITDQLLTLSRDDAGIGQNPREFLDLSRLAAEVVENMRPLAEAKQLQLRTVLNGQTFVYGDSARLRHVIYNLLDNAIKYTAEGGNVELTVAKSDNCVRLQVSDTGIGIAAENLPHVFERFYRADKARSRSAGGTGLGLSIVQSIVVAHAGSVEVTSTLGEGARFIVTIPRGGSKD